jgi:hypothetical protein
MNEEQMERAIAFLLEHHARLSVDLETLKESQKHQAESIAGLEKAVAAMGDEMREGFDRLGTEMREGFDRVDAEIDRLVVEMREGFNNLIVSNEVTRDLAQRIGQLAISTSQRVTELESRH